MLILQAERLVAAFAIEMDMVIRVVAQPLNAAHLVVQDASSVFESMSYIIA